ncbi:PP2C family protein-serine/threonine phosphatase [Streptomyces avermitilis]|uniref:PP2C family protein-serine/threonine phosphatase n=1 Tax=Streptomyces avermitilis TaxID=33903 RepID=UPI0033B14702
MNRRSGAGQQRRARRSSLDLPPGDAGRTDAVQRQKLLRVHGRSVAWIPPVALLAAIAAFDWNTTGEFRVISWVVLVPGIAAAICGVWGTLVIAALALGTFVLEDNSWPHQYQTGLPDFILVVAGGALAVLACVVRVRGEQRMLHMRDIAETTRSTVLRPLPPGWGGLEHAAVYLAADSEARVGGDFYDIQPGPQGTRLLLGDVQGKGLGAVAAAAALLGTFREAAYHEPDLGTVAAHLEVRMARHVRYCAAVGRDNDADADRFATVVLVGFPETDPSYVEVVNFGHEPPLVVTPEGVRSLPAGEGLPAGFGELAHGSTPPTLRVPLTPGETLLLVTDGVTEARDAAGEFYPLRERVAGAVAADRRVAEPARLVRYVRDGTLRHCGGRLDDDTTIFAVRRHRPGKRSARSPFTTAPPGAP